MSLVNVSNLSLCFLGKELFHELGFQVEPGERIGLVGPNGSGKTTLLRLLTGEVSPDEGEIKIGEQVVINKVDGLMLYVSKLQPDKK